MFIVTVAIRNVLLEKTIQVFLKLSEIKYD